MYCLCNHLYMYCLCNHFYVSNPNALAILYIIMVMPIKLLLNLNWIEREREKERCEERKWKRERIVGKRSSGEKNSRRECSWETRGVKNMRQMQREDMRWNRPPPLIYFLVGPQPLPYNVIGYFIVFDFNPQIPIAAADGMLEFPHSGRGRP